MGKVIQLVDRMTVKRHIIQDRDTSTLQNNMSRHHMQFKVSTELAILILLYIGVIPS